MVRRANVRLSTGFLLAFPSAISPPALARLTYRTLPGAAATAIQGAVAGDAPAGTAAEVLPESSVGCQPVSVEAGTLMVAVVCSVVSALPESLMVTPTVQTPGSASPPPGSDSCRSMLRGSTSTSISVSDMPDYR